MDGSCNPLRGRARLGSKACLYMFFSSQPPVKRTVDKRKGQKSTKRRKPKAGIRAPEMEETTVEVAPFGLERMGNRPD